jgi:hypothetical protein
VHYKRYFAQNFTPYLYSEINWEIGKKRTSYTQLPLNFVRFQVLTAASMKFRIAFWDVLPCKIIVDRRFRGMCYLHHHGWLFYMAVHPRRQFWTSLLNSVRWKSNFMFLFPIIWKQIGRNLYEYIPVHKYYLYISVIAVINKLTA